VIAPNIQSHPSKLNRALIGKYDKPVPRYTSYPTAPHFHEGYGSGDKQHDLILAGNECTPFSLYIHLPFCSSVCLFCGCHVTPTRQRSRADRYIAYLLKELTLTADALGTKKPIDQLHFGGGSPTFFTPKQLAFILGEIQGRFPFTREAELSIECNPRETTQEHLRVLRDLGMNRLSFGVQDLNQKVQKAVNRIEPEPLLRSLVREARTLNYQSISFDLIYGLPHQTPASFTTTLNRIMALQPDRLALFNFAYLPDRIPRQRALDASALPSARQKCTLFETSMNFLHSQGYVHIGLDHFALPGDALARALAQETLQRNFQGYHAKPAMDLIGLGTSSISSLGPTYSQNAKSIAIWEAKLDAHRLPVERGIRLTNEDCWRRKVIQDILCRNRVDFPAVAKSFRRQPAALVAEAHRVLAAHERDGLVHWRDDELQVNASGRLLVRNIASAFDAHLKSSSPHVRYSKAI